MNPLNTLDPAVAAGLVKHPAWCDPSRCTVQADRDPEDAAHLSRIAELDAVITTAGPEDIDVWLHQGAAGGPVHLVVDVIGAARAMFPLRAATAAARTITQLLDDASTDEGADQS